MTKVLHVISDLGAGGAERALAGLVADRVAGAGLEHRVLCLREGGFYAPMVEAAGAGPDVIGGDGLGAVPRWIAGVRAAVRRMRPQIVQSWMYYANVIAYGALRTMRRQGGARLVWGIRCSDMDLDRYPSSLRRAVRIGARLSGKVDCIVANSHAGRQAHLALGYAGDRFRVIENGFDTAKFRPDPALRAATRRELGLDDDAFAVGIVARVDPMKDYPAFLAALERVPNAVGVAVGAGTEALVGPANFRGIGRQSDSQRYHNAFDVLVSCSAFGEGMSNAIGEAMACGCPVVATDVGDARRMLTGGDDLPPAGEIVAPGDAGALGDRLAVLMADPARARALGEAGHARVMAHYTLEQCTRRYAALYEELAGPLAPTARGQPAD